MTNSELLYGDPLAAENRMGALLKAVIPKLL